MPMSQDEMESDPSSSARSIELLSKDPALYGKVLAQEAFDHFVSSSVASSASREKRESDKA